MKNYIAFLLEADAAKRRLGELFESETIEPADQGLRAIIGIPVQGTDDKNANG